MKTINNLMMNWSLLLNNSVNHVHKLTQFEKEIQEEERQKLIETITGLSIVALLASIPTYWLLRYVYGKLRKEFRFKTKFNTYNHVDALVLLSMNVLRTNPEDFHKKCVYLKEYIAYLYPENNSFYESLKMSYNDVYRSESIVNWLNRFQEERQRKDVVRFLIHMAAKDGVVAPREKKELLIIIDAFGLKRKEWESLINSINEEYVGRQNRSQNTQNAPSKNYKEDLIAKALDYFGMRRESMDDQSLRARYRQLVKKYHPDRHPDATREERNEWELKFQELQVYYEELLKLLV